MCVLQIPCAAAPRAVVAEWQTVACVPVDLPPEAMFEVTRSVDDFEAPAVAWQAAKGGQNAKCHLFREANMRHGGQAALRVDYDFVGKPEYEYIHINTPLEIPKAGYAFGFCLNHDGTGFPIRLRIVDAGGETHQVEPFSSGGPGWQFVAGSLDGHSTSWGGDGNESRDYPCHLVGICLVRPLIIFDYNNPHYDDDGFPNSPETIAAFSAYAVELVRQTRGTVGMFEVWNEWIGGCGMRGRPGDHGPEAYGRLLKPAYAAVKQACGDLTVVGIAGPSNAQKQN